MGHPQTHGWGFDMDFRMPSLPPPLSEGDAADNVQTEDQVGRGKTLEEEMDVLVGDYVKRMQLRKEREGGDVVGVGYGMSVTRERKRGKEEEKRARKDRRLAKLTQAAGR